jgi:hypothetical protein
MTALTHEYIIFSTEDRHPNFYFYLSLLICIKPCVKPSPYLFVAAATKISCITSTFQLFRIEFSLKLASTPICLLNGTQLAFRCCLTNNSEALEGPKGAKTRLQIILDMAQVLMSIVVRGPEVLIPLLPPMLKHFLIQVPILKLVEVHLQRQKFIPEKEATATIPIAIKIEGPLLVERVLG